jgi:hypothetical protein
MVVWFVVKGMKGITRDDDMRFEEIDCLKVKR